MKINIIGDLFGTTGYANHNRGLSNALFKFNPDIKLDVPLPPTWMQEVNDAELQMIKKEPRTPDVTIAIMTPPFWKIGLGDNCGKFVGYCVWEGDKIPKYWIEYLMDERVDQIWCPSKHTKRAIENTIEEWEGVEQNKILDKIKIVPHGYNPKIFYSQRKKNKLSHEVCLETRSKSEEDNMSGCKTEDTNNHADSPEVAPRAPFKFICSKGWRGGMEDRGGVQYVLQAYANEFKKDENVELILKLNPAYINPNQVAQKIDELKLPKDAGKIKICCANLTPEKLKTLYEEADVCVCATRAEAFDLGTAEAMACGLPIITTGYGGQIEHMDETCADFIDYDMKEVKGDVMYEGCSQSVPDIKHLQKLLREAVSARQSTIKKGILAQKYIKDWTWDNSAKIALGFLE